MEQWSSWHMAVQYIEMGGGWSKGRSSQNRQSYLNSYSLGMQSFILFIIINNATFLVNSFLDKRKRMQKKDWMRPHPLQSLCIYVPISGIGENRLLFPFSLLFFSWIFTYSFSLKFLAFPSQNWLYAWEVPGINIPCHLSPDILGYQPNGHVLSISK